MHKLWVPYCAAMAHNALLSSPEEEIITRFWGHLGSMFGGHARQSKSSVTSSGINAEVDQISSLENKAFKKKTVTKQNQQVGGTN